MTDKKDDMEMNPDVMDEEILNQEESFEGEDWQDELPPEDDFHDHDDFSDDMPLEDDVLEEELEPLDDIDEPYQREAVEADQEVAKKKGRLVFGAVVGAGLLVVGGLAYMQFSEPDQATSRPLTSLLDIKEVKKAPVLAAKKDQTDIAPSPEKVDMVSLYKASGSSSEVELPLPGESGKLKLKKDDLNKEGIALSDVLVDDGGTQKMPSSDMPMPKKDEIKKVEEIKVSQLKKDVPPPQLKVIKEVFEPASDVEKRLSDMTAQLDVLKVALDKATQENVKLVSQMETMQKQVQEATPPNLDLEAKIEELESKLALKDKALKANQQKVSTKKVTASKKKLVQKTYKKRDRKKTRKMWVLRGATPDSAWIAPSRHSKELRRVVVGDMVPYIGRVKEIRQKGSNWQIVGTKGVIK